MLVVTMDPVFKGVAVVAEVLAAETLLGRVVMQKVCWSAARLFLPSPTSHNLADQNYRTAGAALVNQVGLTAVNIRFGNLIPASGLTSFTLTLLWAIGLAGMMVTECPLRKTWEKIHGKAGPAVSRCSGVRRGGSILSPSPSGFVQRLGEG